MTQKARKENGCRLCPRECMADRLAGDAGVCHVSGADVYVARASLHMWEEPCISSGCGSGTVFFCGCPLGCVYCQNHKISGAGDGRALTAEQLAAVFLGLQKKGAANINLVTPTHYTPQIIQAIERARADGLQLPIVYNCGGYEKVETLRSLKGYVDIYLTDFKYMESEPARRYSHAGDYPETAKAALAEMVRQQPQPEFSEDGRMTRGVIVRHLLLPGHVRNAKAVVRYVYETYGDQVYISLMNQYTPLPQVKDRFSELDRRVTAREYDRLVDFALQLGVENGFIQEGATAQESFIPDFNGEGL